MLSRFPLFLVFIGSAFGQNGPGWINSQQPTPAQVSAWASAADHSSSALEDDPPVSVTQQVAAASLGAAPASAPPTPSAGGNEADEITPAISLLACGLHFDPLKIFEFVHNYIEYEPYYGSKKGAHLTLLEGGGNDFDQCALMMALLRASGKTATYKFGACDFSYSQLVKWTGLSPAPYSHWTDAQFFDYYSITTPAVLAEPLKWRKRLAVYEFMTSRGFFYVDPFTFSGDEWFSLPHVWIEYSDNGTTRKLSPSFKDYDEWTGIDLVTASGYNRAQLLADAAGTVGTTPDSITSLNYSAISSKLSSLTSSLLTHLKNNENGREAAKVTGTRSIKKVIYSSLAGSSLVRVWTACPWQAVETWTAIPDPQMSKIQIQCGTGAYSGSGSTGSFATQLYNQTVKMPGLRGRKLSLAFSGNTASIRLDESLLGTAFTVSGAAVNVRLHATHNHYELDGSYAPTTSSIGKSNQAEIKSYSKADTNAYAFIYSFSNPDKLSRDRQEILDGYRRSGLTETDWRVKTELLNIIGLQWLHQTWQQERVISPLFSVLPVTHHQFGRVAQEQSFYIDVGLGLSAPAHRNQNFDNARQFHDFVALVASAMEHGVIEQMQGDDKSATSTVKMMYLANQQAIPVYRATSANWTSVKSQLVNYSGAAVTAGQFVVGVQYKISTSGTTNFVAIGSANNTVGTVFTATGSGSGTGTASPTGIGDIDASITGNSGVTLLPKNGQITLNQWKGVGYAIEEPGQVFMKISGGYFGGYNSQPGTVNLGLMTGWIIADPAYSITPGTLLSVPYGPHTTPPAVALDPVDMASGAFVLDKDDLAVGVGASPRGLSFSRHYNSNRRYDKSAGLGYGWTHNYEISAVKRSSVKAGLSETISYHAAPFYTAMKAAADLYTNHTTAKEWTTAALVVHWAVDRLKYNSVAVSLGNKTIEFIKMPDGTYEAPAGMKLTLTSTGSGGAQFFTLTEQNGSIFTFNNAGKIVTIVDLWGKTQTFAYSGTQLSSVTDGYGRTLTFGWSGGHISSVSDSTGRTVGLVYTGDDLTAATDVESKTWSYVYDGEHRMTHTKDPSARTTVQNFYDSENRVCEQWNSGSVARIWTLCYTGYCNTEVSPQGTRTCFLFDSRGRAIGTVNALGQRAENFYDGQDRMVKTTTRKGEIDEYYFDKNHNLIHLKDAGNQHSYTTYDTQNRPQTITDKRGKITTVTAYNANHQPTQVTAPLSRTTNTTYTATGETNTVTDPEGNVTDYDYDSKGQVTLIKVNGQTTQQFTYTNDRGDPATSVDALGGVTSFTYNKRRQLLKTTLPAIAGQPAAERIHAYDDEGNLATTTDPRGNVSGHTYTATGKPSTVTFPAIPVLGGGVLSNVLTMGYDLRDLPFTTGDSLGYTSTVAYDSSQRVTGATDALNRTTTTVYDSNDRATQITDPLLRVTKIAYTSRGEKNKATDSLNKDTIYTYDANGNQDSLKNRRGKTYGFTYDDASRLVSTTTPTGKVTSQTYWDNDLLKSVTEPSAQVVTFTYDNRLRLQSKVDPVGTISYGYDANGNIQSITEGGSSITKTYDVRARLKTFTNADGELVKYDYDAANNLTRITYPPDASHPTGKQVSYTFNARNSLETVTDWVGRVTTYRYDRLGRLLRIDRPNGTSCVRELDAAGQLLSQREIITATSRVFHFQKFSYDAAGQVSSKFTAPVGHPWTDPAFTGTYDDDNRLLTANGIGVTHDADGNMTSGPITATSGIQTLVYNARNQLTSAEGITYTYDPEGRRRTMVQGAATTRYTIDPNGLSRVLIKHNPDSTKTYYVYGLGLLYEVSSAETYLTHHYDQVGSTVIRTDDTGNDVGRAEYSSYGQITWQTGNMATPFLYNGKLGVMTDPNGLLHMRARFYSPYLMRFVNPDPTGFSGGSNWFAFADGNPTSANDPFGLKGNWVDYNGNWLHDNLWASTVNTIAGGYDALDAMGNAILHPVDTVTGIGKQIVWETKYIATDPMGYVNWAGTSIKNTAVSVVTDPHAFGEFATGMAVGQGVGKVFGTAGKIVTTETEALSIRVIGKLDDTARYDGRPGYSVIPSEPWGIKINYEWVQDGINAKAPFKLVSPTTPGNLINSPGGLNIGPSSFGRELWQLMDNGYKPVRHGSDVWTKLK